MSRIRKALAGAAGAFIAALSEAVVRSLTTGAPLDWKVALGVAASAAVAAGFAVYKIPNAE